MTFHRRFRMAACAAVFAAGIVLRVPSPITGPASVMAATGTGQSSARLVGVVTDVDSHAGETFSGSIVINPTDFTKTPGVNVITVRLPEASGTRAGQPVDLSRLVIDFGGGNAQAGDRPFTLTPPVGSATVPFTVRELGQGAAPEANSAVRLSVTVVPPERGFQMPSVVMPGDTVAIHGAFPGDARLTHIDLDRVPINPLTETPFVTRLRIPSDTALGPHQLTVGTRQGPVAFDFNVLTLTMSADRLSLLRGESTAFHVAISGADKIPDSSWKGATAPRDADLATLRGTPGFKMPRADEEGRIFLRLENRTRQTVTMRPGKDEVELRSLSKEEFHNGVYRMDGVIRSRVAGNFNIDGLVVAFLAPVAGSPAPPAPGSNPFQEGLNRFRTATDAVRRAMDSGADGEKVRGLVNAAFSFADRVTDGVSPGSWNIVAGAPELQWLMFASAYAERLVALQRAYGKPNLEGEVGYLVDGLKAMRSLVEGEKLLPEDARQAVARLATADREILRAVDAGNSDAVNTGIQAARTALHQIFDTLPEFAQPESNGTPRAAVFDFQIAEAEALQRALNAATPDTMSGLMTGSYDKEAVNAALAQADAVARAFEARTKR